jgi:hypothetical protein
MVFKYTHHLATLILLLFANFFCFKFLAKSSSMMALWCRCRWAAFLPEKKSGHFSRRWNFLRINFEKKNTFFKSWLCTFGCLQSTNVDARLITIWEARNTLGTVFVLAWPQIYHLLSSAAKARFKNSLFGQLLQNIAYTFSWSLNQFAWKAK